MLLVLILLISSLILLWDARKGRVYPFNFFFKLNEKRQFRGSALYFRVSVFNLKKKLNTGGQPIAVYNQRDRSSVDPALR